MKKIILLSIILLFAACNREIIEPVSEPDLPEFLSAPLNVELSLGDKMLSLAWQMTDTAGIAGYLIYRAEYFSDTLELAYTVIDSTVTQGYADDNLLNGRRYYYQITAFDNDGIEGYKSSTVSGVPDLFSIVINGGEEVTGTRQVALSIIASGNTVSMMFSNTSDFVEANWESATNSRNWVLSESAGEKTVYVRFRDFTGNLTFGDISDDITYEIQTYQYTIEANGGAAKTFSRDLNLAINAPQGTSYMKVSDRVDYQDADWEDYSANKAWHISPSSAQNGDVINFYAVFRDAGLDSLEVEAVDDIILANADPVDLLPINNPADHYNIIDLQWSRSLSEDFYIYRVFRSFGNSNVDTIVTTIGEITQTQYFDTLAIDYLPEGVIDSVYYAIRFYSNYDDSTDSDTILVTLSNDIPATVSAYIGNVTYESNEGGGLDMTAILGWSQSSIPDFSNYIVFENTVDNSASANPISYEYNQNNLTYTLLKTFEQSDIDSLDYEYFYWLKVIDTGGLESDYSESVQISE